jgi:hypothetical protein
MTKSEIIREIARVEALIGSPESKGKVSSLKAYHKKLAKEYSKAEA